MATDKCAFVSRRPAFLVLGGVGKGLAETVGLVECSGDGIGRLSAGRGLSVPHKETSGKTFEWHSIKRAILLYSLLMEYVLMLTVPLLLFAWYWLIFRKEK